MGLSGLVGSLGWIDESVWLINDFGHYWYKGFVKK